MSAAAPAKAPPQATSGAPAGIDEALASQASGLTVGELVTLQAQRTPGAVALDDGTRQLSFAQLEARSERLARALAARGLVRGDRVAILSENRTEYVELTLACARLGAILCALNWRLAPAELAHCIGLTTPGLLVRSGRHEGLLRDALARGGLARPELLALGEPYEAALAAAPAEPAPMAARPEDGLLILYTSGTTGLPKGALITHRAEIARMQVNVLDLGLRPGDAHNAFAAWAPMYHMASLEQVLHTLAVGGVVHVLDGWHPERLAALVTRARMWWLIVLPGTVEAFIAALERVKVPLLAPIQIGGMADLVPAHQIAEVTKRLGAPYLNTFGSTETGLPPLSGGHLAVGEVPRSLAKRPSSLCRFRLVDPEDRDVPDGAPGELAFRGPTCFSGYWNAPEANARDFRGGWFHLGDMFVRREDGRYDFVDRVKYLIKSGGENVYPAEIERVLLSDPRVTEAVVVRRADARWGEVPVAFVARSDASLSADALAATCRGELAGYKQPKEIRFVAFADFPRSTTGKVQRHEVERWLSAPPAGPTGGGA